MNTQTNQNTGACAHTPGPWVARPFEDSRHSPALMGYDIEAHPDFNNGFSIAHVAGSQEMHANARLIASAPELLAALQAVLAADDIICENVGSKSDQAMTRIAALDQAARAIAKATGGNA
jgi:hypothetical protein